VTTGICDCDFVAVTLRRDEALNSDRASLANNVAPATTHFLVQSLVTTERDGYELTSALRGGDRFL
jgi:hypothetical protein